MLITETKVVVVLEAESPHSRKVIETLLAHNKEQRQRVHNLVGAELLHALSIAPAPPFLLSNAESVAAAAAAAAAANARPKRPMKATASLLGIDVPSDLEDDDDDDEETGSRKRPWPYKTLPPSLDSPALWSAVPSLSTVHDSAMTSMVHVDRQGRVAHVGLRDPVTDTLRESRLRSEQMRQLWKRANMEQEQLEREAEERRRRGQADDPSIRLMSSTERAMKQKTAMVRAARNGESYDPRHDGNIPPPTPRALQLLSAAAVPFSMESPMQDSHASASLDLSTLRLEPKSMTFPSTTPIAWMSEAELSTEHERRVDEQYHQPWSIRAHFSITRPTVRPEEALHGGREAALLQYERELLGEGVEVIWADGREQTESSLSQIFQKAWGVFSALFDEQGFPRRLAEDWQVQLSNAAIQTRVAHLIVCSIVDSPLQSDDQIPSSILATRRLLFLFKDRQQELPAFTHLATCLAFETAYDYNLFEFRERHTQDPRKLDTRKKWAMHCRFPTRHPLPFSSIDDVGPAVLTTWLQGRSGQGAPPREWHMVSDFLAADAALAQCHAVIWRPGDMAKDSETKEEADRKRRIVMVDLTLAQWHEDTEEHETRLDKVLHNDPIGADNDDVFLRTWGGRECRRLLDFWLRFPFDATAIRYRPKVTPWTVSSEPRVTAWNHWILSRLDSLLPEWDQGVLIDENVETDREVSERLARLLLADHKESDPRLIRLRHMIADNDPGLDELLD